MSAERPLPSNRRTRPRGVPLLPPDIGELAPPPPAPRSRKAAPPVEAPALSETMRSGIAAKRRSFTLRNPLRGRGPALLTLGRMILGAALFFALVGVSSFGLYRYVSTTARFAVKTILVEGAAHRPQTDLTQLAGVSLGKNIFTLDLEAARRGLLADPWIERATVDRKLPGTVTLQVVEREPLALISLGGSLYLTSRGGEVFKRVEGGDPIDFPIITGLGGEGELVRDREGVASTARRAQELIADYQRLGPRSLPLQEVHVSVEGTFDLIVGRDGVRLVLGKPPYRSKIERGARVLLEIERRRGQASVIFLDNEAHQERVVARMK